MTTSSEPTVAPDSKPAGLHVVAKVVGLAALGGTIIPPALFMMGSLSHGLMQTIMLVAAVAWFASAPFWMRVE